MPLSTSPTSSTHMIGAEPATASQIPNTTATEATSSRIRSPV